MSPFEPPPSEYSYTKVIRSRQARAGWLADWPVACSLGDGTSVHPTLEELRRLAAGSSHPTSGALFAHMTDNAPRYRPPIAIAAMVGASIRTLPASWLQ